MKFHREAISYILVGGATTLINLVFYGLFVSIAGFSIPTGNGLAWVASVIYAFFANKILVFQSRNWQPLVVLIEGLTFLGARIVTGIIDMVSVPFLFYIGLTYPLLGIEGFAAKIIVGIVIIILNYIFSKFFIFYKKKE